MRIVFLDEFDSTLGGEFYGGSTGGYNIFFPCTRDTINLTLENSKTRMSYQHFYRRYLENIPEFSVVYQKLPILLMIFLIVNP